MSDQSNHRFYEGAIYHKRVHPKTHEFKYKFYLLDIDVADSSSFEKLKNSFFSINRLNFLSFKTKDHFGTSDNFLENIDGLLEKFNLEKSSKLRFITLPRVLNFVFNPISILMVFDKDSRNYKKYTKILAKHIKSHTMKKRVNAHIKTIETIEKIEKEVKE